MVTFTYRTQPDEPPDVKTIQKQMAIVAWQPGANRVVVTPGEVGLLGSLCDVAAEVTLCRRKRKQPCSLGNHGQACSWPGLVCSAG